MQITMTYKSDGTKLIQLVPDNEGERKILECIAPFGTKGNAEVWANFDKQRDPYRRLLNLEVALP